MACGANSASLSFVAARVSPRACTIADEFLEAGKHCLAGDTERATTNSESRICVGNPRAQGSSGRTGPGTAAAQKSMIADGDEPG